MRDGVRVKLIGSASFNDFLIPSISFEESFLWIPEVEVSLRLGGKRGLLEDIDLFLAS
jgi:hypothetical protein